MARPHGIGGVYLLDGDGAHARAGIDGDGSEAGEENQEQLAGLADPEPDDRQRQIGQRRDRAVELDGRIEDAPRMPAHAHRNADRHRGHGGEGKGAEDAVQAPEDVLMERVVAESVAFRLDLGLSADRDQQSFEIVVRAGDLGELRDYHLGRRQEQGPDQPKLGDDPPAPEKHHDRGDADRRAGTAPRRAVLLDRLRAAPPEEPRPHGSSSPASSP